MSNKPTSKVIQISTAMIVNSNNCKDLRTTVLCEDRSIWETSDWRKDYDKRVWECILEAPTPPVEQLKEK